MAGNFIGIGLDLIDLERFRLNYGGEDAELASRCFTSDELAAVGTDTDRVQRLAARFAAKEAVLKAIGGADNVSMTDIEVRNDPSGQPNLVLKGLALEVAERRGVDRLLLSMTHSDASAAAVVVALSVGPK